MKGLVVLVIMLFAISTYAETVRVLVYGSVNNIAAEQISVIVKQEISNWGHEIVETDPDYIIQCVILTEDYESRTTVAAGVFVNLLKVKGEQLVSTYWTRTTSASMKTDVQKLVRKINSGIKQAD